ncbi:hypothetical protein EDD85DRAFT_794799 [Armillaria nabsnona]|nr:hypothetical protein EDD85DRAFT_794799 [Armillaria nabsnona]
MDECAVQFDERQLLVYSDKELNHFILRSPPVPIDDEFQSSVRILSSSFVAKYVSPRRSRVPADEVSAMKLAESIGIRVPQIHRIVQEAGASSTGGQFLIMARLRRYIRTMRQCTSVTAGGLVSGSAFCKLWDFDSYGPELHASPENLREYMNWWFLRLLSTKPQFHLELNPFSTFMFSHMDFHARNMMVDERRQLWLIDWGSAGYIPPSLSGWLCGL